MKILIIGPEARQVWRFRRHLALELKDLGHEVVLCGPHPDPSLPQAAKKAGLGFEPLDLERSGTGLWADLATFRSIGSLLHRLEPDLLLVTSLKPILYGSLAARRWSKGRVFSIVSGAGSLFMGNSPQKLLLRTLVLPLLRVALSRNESVFFQNQDDRELFLSRGLLGPSKATLIAGSGVDLKEFPARPLPQGPPRFLFLGRFLREKGLGDFAKAAALLKARHPRASFQAMGDLDPNPGSFQEKDLAAWRGEGALEFPGAMDDVRPALARSTVFVLPSYYREGVPRSALEALATGRAIVTCDSPGCRETVVEGKNGFLVPPHDPKTLAATMERFLLEPGSARRMGRASRALAVSKFDVRKVNRTILSTFFGSAPRRRAPRL